MAKKTKILIVVVLILLAGIGVNELVRMESGVSNGCLSAVQKKQMYYQSRLDSLHENALLAKADMESKPCGSFGDSRIDVRMEGNGTNKSVDETVKSIVGKLANLDIPEAKGLQDIRGMTLSEGRISGGLQRVFPEDRTAPLFAITADTHSKPTAIYEARFYATKTGESESLNDLSVTIIFEQDRDIPCLSGKEEDRTWCGSGGTFEERYSYTLSDAEVHERLTAQHLYRYKLSFNTAPAQY